MESRNKFFCNCNVCKRPLTFNSRKNKKKCSCRSCGKILCKECTRHIPSQDGRMGKMCNTCSTREVSNKGLNTSTPTPNVAPIPTNKLLDENNLSKVVDKIVNCPICQDLMKKPIVLCTEGHSMCEVCVAGKVSQCPLCKALISKTRNYALEKFMSDLNLTPTNNFDKTCKYLERGCAKYFERESDKSAHERECILRDIKCLLKDSYENCRYVGPIEEYVDHFERYHEEKVWRNNNEGIANINLEVNVNNFSIISFMNGRHYFLLRHRRDVKLQKAYWAIQLIGSKDIAKEYNYKFEISNGRRKLKKTEICENDTTDCNKIFGNENCFAIPFKNLITYLDSSGQLKFKFQIFKTTERDMHWVPNTTNQ
ncbi:E3 ubiquitin-protein ligase SIAH1A-like isoform X2 [Harmonia axyridis]|nr:E3 ubiquitin-protein ligase SIAH1A-like isoform X2 [Harmonia axyridis]XP_045480617.1 E3 ubiquitin-protein ligase SIAH1A-like isoform X2 [Harmonia axyridis]